MRWIREINIAIEGPFWSFQLVTFIIYIIYTVCIHTAFSAKLWSYVYPLWSKSFLMYIYKARLLHYWGFSYRYIEYKVSIWWNDQDAFSNIIEWYFFGNHLLWFCNDWRQNRLNTHYHKQKHKDTHTQYKTYTQFTIHLHLHTQTLYIHWSWWFINFQLIVKG